MSGPCYLQLANGWTVSISDSDTPPALCTVAAWPTALHEQRVPYARWMQFDQNGAIDRRCWVLEDIREALTLVNAALPPVLG